MKKFLLYLCFLPSFLLGHYQYDLAICAIFQNDAKYLPEWIEFHQRQGVQHFYLYDNLSEDNPQAILKPYIDSGLVEVFSWSFTYEKESEWTPIQCGAYMDCVERIRKTVRWCAFLDTDEFLFSPDFKDLKKVMKNYQEYMGVYAYWVMYGTSHVKKIPEGEKMLDHLVYRDKKDYTTGKSIVRPKYVHACVNPHFFIFTKDFRTVNEKGDPICFDAFFINDFTAKKLRINHYWSRDEDFFFNVKIPRRQRWSNDIQTLLDWNENMNEVYDPILKKNE